MEMDGMTLESKKGGSNLTKTKALTLPQPPTSSPSPFPRSNNITKTTTTAQTYPNLNQLTINEYTPGQGIGSHVDTETAFDDGLLIVSLNGGIVMEFRQVLSSGDDDGNSNKEDDGSASSSNLKKKLLYLPPRSLVLLSKDARYKWEHMIVSRKTDTVDGVVIPRKLRVSLTLRTALSAPQSGIKKAEPLSIYESNVFPLKWGQLSDVDAATLAARSKSNNDDHNEQHPTTSSSSTNRSDLLTPSTESKHVHDVYDAIATQWHHTRGKRGVLWRGATNFLEKIPPGSIVADVGCGDGKYFSAILEYGSYVIGSRMSGALWCPPPGARSGSPRWP